LLSVSAEKMAEIDKRAREEYGLSQEYLMERAGESVARIVLKNIPPGSSKDIMVICGKGNNGGDGFVAARYLARMNSEKVRVYFSGSDSVSQGAAFENLKKAEAFGISLKDLSSVQDDIPGTGNELIVIDALLGIGCRGPMTGSFADIAKKINTLGAEVYSVDVPSGLNATTGEVLGECFRASTTVTFGLPKTGFYKGQGPDFCGRISLVDIGFPPELISEFL
jgi:hydroxyethylthiazole kinase-like uncharacterized protein yjeF